MIEMIQGPVSDALDGEELYIMDYGCKQGYLVEKQDMYTYGDVIVGLDNLSGDFDIVSYQYIWFYTDGIYLQCGDVRCQILSALMEYYKVTGQFMIRLYSIKLLK